VDHQIEGTKLVPKKVTKHRFRKTIIAAWEGRCAYCDEVLGRNATLDHIVPRSKGGETQATNLVACCLSCNSHKSSHPVFEWFKEQHWYCPLRENRLRDWIAGRAHNYFPNESQEKVEWVPPDPPQSSQFPERY
jgi:hypothetical protein